MRGRPPLPLGTFGTINTTKTTNGYQASTYLRLYTGKTVRVRASAKTKTAAQTAIKDRCAKRLNVTDTATLTSASTINQLTQEWLGQKTDISPQTTDRYEAAIRNHITPGIGEIRLNEITPAILDTWVKGIPAGSANNALSVLKGAFGMAVRYGLIQTSPLTHVQPPKAPKKAVDALTIDQIPEFRKTIHTYAENVSNAHTADLLRDVIDLSLSTGLRLGEILAIRWTDIEGEILHITGTIVFSKEHGNHRQDWPKTATSVRAVQLGNVAQNIIQRRRSQDWAQHCDMLFPSVRLTYMAEANFNRLFRKAKGEEWKWVTVHTLRRTVATIINDQLGTKQASDLLGHADMALTQRVYIARNKDGIQVGKVIDQVLN